jgi:hypothetical protein
MRGVATHAYRASRALRTLELLVQDPLSIPETR